MSNLEVFNSLCKEYKLIKFKNNPFAAIDETNTVMLLYVEKREQIQIRLNWCCKLKNTEFYFNDFFEYTEGKYVNRVDVFRTLMSMLKRSNPNDMREMILEELSLWVIDLNHKSMLLKTAVYEVFQDMTAAYLEKFKKVKTQSL